MACDCCCKLTAYDSTDNRKLVPLIMKFNCRKEVIVRLNELDTTGSMSFDITGPVGEVDVALKLSDGRWYLQSKLDRNFDWDIYNSLADDDMAMWELYDRYVYLYDERHGSDLRSDKPAIWHKSTPSHTQQWEPEYSGE